MMHFQDMPLLTVGLIVFAGIFLFMLGVDSRVRRLERELREEIDAGMADDNAKR